MSGNPGQATVIPRWSPTLPLCGQIQEPRTRMSWLSIAEERRDAILVGRIDKGQISCRLGYFGVNFGARIMCFVYGALRGILQRKTANCC